VGRVEEELLHQYTVFRLFGGFVRRSIGLA
jgi:hypothetical protein